MDILTAIPERFTAGTTVKYIRTFVDFPADEGWTLNLYLAGASIATVAGSASAKSFNVTLSAAATAGLVAGNYQWVERVAKAGEKFDVAAGTSIVDPDVAVATAGSLQSYNEKRLAVIEAALTGTLTGGMLSYQIEGRAASKIPPAELEALRAKYHALVLAEQRPGHLRVVRAEFTGMSAET